MNTPAARPSTTSAHPGEAFLDAFLDHMPDQVLHVIDTRARAQGLAVARPLLESLSMEQQDRLTAGMTPLSLRNWCATWWGLQESTSDVQRWCAQPLNNAFAAARQEARDVRWAWEHRPAITGSFDALNAWWNLGDPEPSIAMMSQRHVRHTDTTTGWNSGISWMAAPMEIATLTGDLPLMNHLYARGVPLYTPQRTPDDASPLTLALWRAQTSRDDAPLRWLIEHGVRWDQGWKIQEKPSSPPGNLPRWQQAVWSHPGTLARARRQGTPWDLGMREPGPVREQAVQAFLAMPAAARRRCTDACVYAPDDPTWAVVEGVLLEAALARSPDPAPRPVRPRL